MFNQVTKIALMVMFAFVIFHAGLQQVVAKTLLLSHQYSPNSNAGKLIEHWKDLVEERSSGKLRIEIHHSSSLYKANEIVEALQLRSVPMGAGDRELVQFGLSELTLPFVFSSAAEVHKNANRTMPVYSRTGITVLGYFVTDVRVFVSGQKMQIRQDVQWKSLWGIRGSVARKIFSKNGFKIADRFDQKKVRSGKMISSVSLAQIEKLGIGKERFKYGRYLALTKHAYEGTWLAINSDAYNSLEPEYRRILEHTVREISQTAFQQVDRNISSQVAELQNRGYSVETFDTPSAAIRVFRPDTVDKGDCTSGQKKRDINGKCECSSNTDYEECK